MTFEIYLGIGLLIGAVAVYVANKTDLFDKPFDFEEFMLNNLGRLMIFLLSTMMWPLAILVGSCYVYWLWREDELDWFTKDKEAGF